MLKNKCSQMFKAKLIHNSLIMQNTYSFKKNEYLKQKQQIIDMPPLLLVSVSIIAHNNAVALAGHYQDPCHQPCLCPVTITALSMSEHRDSSPGGVKTQIKTTQATNSVPRLTLHEIEAVIPNDKIVQPRQGRMKYRKKECSGRGVKRIWMCP